MLSFRDVLHGPRAELLAARVVSVQVDRGYEQSGEQTEFEFAQVVCIFDLRLYLFHVLLCPVTSKESKVLVVWWGRG